MINKKTKPRPNFVLVTAIIASIIFGFALKKALTAAYHHIIPDVRQLKGKYPVVVGREKNAILIELQKKRPKDWVSLNQVSKEAVRAILISEDAGFYAHKGYEPESIRLAIEHNQKPGVKTIRGGSTITQQVAKNIFLTQEKTMTRKLRELLLAKDLERNFKKREILEFYLNIVEWGKNIYGITEASQYYFGKQPAALSAREGAILAFMLPNPRIYGNSYNRSDMSLTEFGQERVTDILTKMYPPEREESSQTAEDAATAEANQALNAGLTADIHEVETSDANSTKEKSTDVSSQPSSNEEIQNEKND